MSTHCLKKKRLDYFVLWGHALVNEENILKIIRSDPFLKIVRVYRHYPKKVSSIVKVIYSHDYAPLHHLSAKTEYLRGTPKEVLFVFIENQDAQEVWLGEGPFRHIECQRIRAVKEKIRKIFNPSKNDKPSEDHVVHASDNECQTDHILKYLGFVQGVEFLRRKANCLIELPHHIKPIEIFKILSIPISKIRCNLISMGTRKEIDGFNVRCCSIAESPHYACLMGDVEHFRNYLARARGLQLCDDHTPENLINLQKVLRYLEPPHESGYILTKFLPESGMYLILDGLHRASVLAARGEETIVAAVC